MSVTRSLRVAMLHPQLGIGGAERVTLDAALGLRQLGHRPTVFTREVPAGRSFAAADDGSVDVRVLGTRIPLSLRGRLRAPLTAARMRGLARSMAAEREHFDVAILDLVAHAVPALQRSLRKPVLYYCHFPDLLLTPPRTRIYDIYRRPVDALERRGLRVADRVAVNSEFTARAFQSVFPGLPAPAVLHPGIDLGPPPADPPASEDEIILLSLNRFSPSKNLLLAVRTLAKLRDALPSGVFSRVRLVLAGGWDRSEPQAVQALRSLESLVAEHLLSQQISIVLNPSDAALRGHLARCLCVLYTPENEHFGLGPLEAMAAAKPVVAADAGGPCETIRDGRTGRLVPARPEAFAQAVARWAIHPNEARSMGLAGRAHVERNFSRDRFARDLEALLLSMVESAPRAGEV